MPLSRDLREFIECLNSNEVEYLVVGALAVSWHGFPRYSADIDFLIRPSQTNAVRVLRALSQFGFGGLDISTSDLTLPGKVIALPAIWMACRSTSSAGSLSCVTRMPQAGPRTASTPMNSGSRNRRPSFPPWMAAAPSGLPDILRRGPNLPVSTASLHRRCRSAGQSRHAALRQNFPGDAGALSFAQPL